MYVYVNYGFNWYSLKWRAYCVKFPNFRDVIACKWIVEGLGLPIPKTFPLAETLKLLEGNSRTCFGKPLLPLSKLEQPRLKGGLLVDHSCESHLFWTALKQLYKVPNLILRPVPPVFEL
ncbi:hypothetical protein L1987_39990 [Smallanthus sonchifolius]|uniref:Uncharacterized protein n=1 Tax=Smallanthus sonchifolius TaxID=185202 RepID=A0ACB9GS57_9ASTR|nr:hypothetical protein L1987_39990 [Smallanthus sonchifolius]